LSEEPQLVWLQAGMNGKQDKYLQLGHQ